MPSRKPIDPRGGRKLFQEQHKRGAESRAAWHMVGAELERAAELLWDQHDHDMQSTQHAVVGDAVPPLLLPAAVLLAALAVENYLKGNLVLQEGALTASGHFAHKTHKLLDLAERTKLSPTAAELDLLERLEVNLEWAGRYPIPLNYEDLLPRTMPGGGFATRTYVTSTDRQTWRGLVSKLRS